MIDERDIRDMLRRRADAIDAAPEHPIDAVRGARRRATVTVAACVALALVISVAAMSGLDEIRGDVPVQDPTPIETVRPRVEEVQIMIPPAGTKPSEPEVGELIVGFHAEDVYGVGTSAGLSVSVYADGRVIWSGESCSGEPGCTMPPLPPTDLPGEPATGSVEQRLTPDGVEMLRAELIATGLLRAGGRELTSNSTPSVMEYIGITAKEGDEMLSANLRSQGLDFNPPSPEQLEALERLQRIMTDLGAWLPASAWADQTMHAFIPSHYCLWFYPRTPKDPSDLPPPADDLMKGKFTDLSLDEARAIADGFAEAGVLRTNNDRGVSIAYDLVLPYRERRTWLFLEPSLPDRRTTC